MGFLYENLVNECLAALDKQFQVSDKGQEGGTVQGQGRYRAARSNGLDLYSSPSSATPPKSSSSSGSKTRRPSLYTPQSTKSPRLPRAPRPQSKILRYPPKPLRSAPRQPTYSSSSSTGACRSAPLTRRTLCRVWSAWGSRSCPSLDLSIRFFRPRA